MAKILKATILTLSEAPGGEAGVVGSGIAKYVLGDAADASVNQVKFLELSAPDFSLSAEALYDQTVAAIKTAEGIV